MNKQNFDLGWEYSELTGFAAMFNPHAWQPVRLPHDAMIGKPRAATTHPAPGRVFPGRRGQLSQEVSAPEEWRGQSVQLEFEGVYMNAEVSVNNQLVHPNRMAIPASFWISPCLTYGQENTVGVVANNTAQPNSRWYCGTGIYRHVWLRTGGACISNPGACSSPHPSSRTETCVVQVATELACLTRLEGAVLRSTVLDAQGAPVAQVESPAKLLSIQQTMLVKNARLWSVENPTCTRCSSEVRVGGRGGGYGEQPLSASARITVDAEHGLRLNGVPLKMKGGCIHHDHGPLGRRQLRPR